MTGVAWAWLAIAGVFALIDWDAKADPRKRRFEYIAKPATLVALIAVALSLDPSNGTERAWFVAALVFSLAGDVLLMLPSDQFVAGLGAFLGAHVCYIVGFWVEPTSAVAVIVAAAVVLAVIVPLAMHIVRALRAGDDREFAPPVIAYIGVITVMVVSALASGNALAGAGAVLFAGSDSMIAWDRFVRSFRAAPVAIMVTYHVGQALLVVSLVR